MIKWFKRWREERKSKRVFVRTGLIRIDYQDRWPVVYDQELRLWLNGCECKYELNYDEHTGERWIEFKDRAVALECRLIFG